MQRRPKKVNRRTTNEQKSTIFFSASLITKQLFWFYLNFSSWDSVRANHPPTGYPIADKLAEQLFKLI